MQPVAAVQTIGGPVTGWAFFPILSPPFHSLDPLPLPCPVPRASSCHTPAKACFPIFLVTRLRSQGGRLCDAVRAGLLVAVPLRSLSHVPQGPLSTCSLPACHSRLLPACPATPGAPTTQTGWLLAGRRRRRRYDVVLRPSSPHPGHQACHQLSGSCSPRLLRPDCAGPCTVTLALKPARTRGTRLTSHPPCKPRP